VNPNFADWRYARTLVYSGKPKQAASLLQRQMRLDPFYAPGVPLYIGYAFFVLKEYREAVPPLLEAISRAPQARSGHAFLAATYSHMGLFEQAHHEAAEVLRLEPTFAVSRQPKLFAPFEDPRDAEHWLDGLRKAGLPEE
jgi:adenylate cyclase